jgi:hypothetical protein
VLRRRSYDRRSWPPVEAGHRQPETGGFPAMRRPASQATGLAPGDRCVVTGGERQGGTVTVDLAAEELRRYARFQAAGW